MDAADALSKWTPAYSEIGPPWWDDAPAILVGAGGSLKGFDFERLRGLGHIIAVKSAWRDIPWADCCFGLDLPWMKRDQGDLTALAARMPLYLALEPREYFSDITPRIPGAIYLRQKRDQSRLSDDPRVIEAGGNSGFGAFNLAYLKRPRTIVAFGYDFYGDHYAPDRYTHHAPGHNARYLPRWAQIFAGTIGQIRAAGIEVLIATPDSAITAYPRVTHAHALQHLDRIRSARG